MVVMLVTDPTLMPDTEIAVVKRKEDEKDEETVKQIQNDLRKDLNGGERSGGNKKIFINSLIAEVKVDNPPENFKLNIFFKPLVDIVSNEIINLNP